MNLSSNIEHPGDFCPVKIWATIKKRILSYKNTSEKTAVNTFLKNRRLVQITSESIRNHLRKFVISIDPLEKFYQTEKIGTHTIRTSFAMILDSAKVAPHIIKMMGRWLSDAWLRYIRSKLADFSKDLSELMVKTQTAFFNIPSRNIQYQSNLSTTNLQLNGTNSLPESTNPNALTNVYCVWV